MSLKRQAASGFLWVGIERFGQLFLQAILFVVLARLLAPADFGLIAMLTIFFAISQSFIDSGMGQALIRERNISDEDRSTVFWSNLVLSCVFYLFLFIAAPYIAEFYDQPKLESLTRVMGLSVVFFGLTIVQRSELTQKLDFKTQAQANLPTFIIAGVISVALAYLGYGVWSLVVQYLMLGAGSSLFLWLMRPAKILFVWNPDSFNRLFGFGYKLLLSGLLDTVYKNVYKLIIGKLFSASVLGFYTQAQKIRDIITHGLMSVIGTVSYPLLAKSEGDVDQLKRSYQQMIKASSFLVFPSVLLLMMLARPIIQFVLGEQWLPSVPFLQLICIHGVLYHLHAINLNALKVLGRSDLFLKLEVIKKVNTTLAIIISIPFGIYGLLIGQIITSYIALFINGYYTAKLLKYGYLEQAKDVVGITLLSFPMIAVTYVFTQIVVVDSFIVLLVCLMLAGLSYFVTNIIYRTSTAILIFDSVSGVVPNKIKKIFHV